MVRACAPRGGQLGEVGCTPPGAAEPQRHCQPACPMPSSTQTGCQSPRPALQAFLTSSSTCGPFSSPVREEAGQVGVQGHEGTSEETHGFFPESDLQACVLQAYFHLGVNEKLGLSGRPDRPIGCLGSSKVLGNFPRGAGFRGHHHTPKCLQVDSSSEFLFFVSVLLFVLCDVTEVF